MKQSVQRTLHKKRNKKRQNNNQQQYEADLFSLHQQGVFDSAIQIDFDQAIQSINQMQFQISTGLAFLPINRKLLNSSLLHEKIGSQTYQQISEKLLDIGDQTHLSKKVKFIARYLLDLTIDSFSHTPQLNLTPLTSACLHYAKQLAQPYNPNDEQSSIQIASLEKDVGLWLLQVQKALDYNQNEQNTLKSYSPYDYVEGLTVFQNTQIQNKIKEGVNFMIDLALTHPYLATFSAEDIFLGSLKAFIKYETPAISGFIRPVSQLVGGTGRSDEIKNFHLMNILGQS